jgi:hypothetical protein
MKNIIKLFGNQQPSRKAAKVPLLIIALVAVIGFGFAACESLGSSFASLTSGPEKTEYAIGDKGPGGGIVFYDKGNGNDGWRYLEAAPADLEGQLTWAGPSYIDWYIDQDYNDGSRGYWGRVNTATILSVDADAPAAKACVDYRGGGLDGWFLPSGYEFQLIKQHASLYSLFNFKAKAYYWTSSQDSGNRAQRYYSDDKQFGAWDKDKELNVRPIRAFLTSKQGAPAVQPIDQTEVNERRAENAAYAAEYAAFFASTNRPSPVGTWNDRGDIYTFNANGTGSYKGLVGDGYVTTNLTWKVNLNKLSLTYINSGWGTAVYTFDISGNTLIWLRDGGDYRNRYTLTRQ